MPPIVIPKIPITVVCGFAGAGKSTLLQHLVGKRDGYRMAVFVNDLRRDDADGPGTNGDIPLRAGKDRLVELTNGCVCCSLQESFLMEIRRAFRSKDFDYILVEASSVAKPLGVAETLCVDDGRGVPVTRNTALDTMVTVVAADTFLADFRSKDTLKDRGILGGGTVGRTVAEVLADQIETADVVVIAKADLAGEEQLAAVESKVRALNPYAKVLRAAKGQIEPSEALATGKFDFHAWTDRAGTTADFDGRVPALPAGWMRLPYRRFRPFHPERFEELIHAEWPGIVRSRGVFWLASRPDVAHEWTQAGPTHHHHTIGSFWAATPEGDWQVSDERKAKIKAIWSEPHGDRRQELVLVGRTADCESLEKLLDACLLTDAEMAAGPEGWKAFPDAIHDH